ncbi:MAG: OmpH family outer membrane protein [Proteobacteria bacterium]|nr:OmpH family outer membrane protein [Pseudomonadota bacterium]
MKKILVLLIIAFLALQAPAFAQDLKVAVINTAQVIATSLAGKHGEQQVQAKIAPIRQEFEKMQNEFKSVVESYKKQQAALSVENRQMKEIEIKRRQNELQEMAGAYRQADQAARKELLPPVHRFLEKAASEYLESQKYNLVIDQTRGALAYYDRAFDVSEAVVKYCDEQWKAKGN